MACISRPVLDDRARAWLYALPVERFFDLKRAAQANLILLAIVSLWRVLLMARIISVLQKVDSVRAFGWVIVPACLEVIFLGTVGALFNPRLSRQIMAAMAGLRNSPEDEVLRATVGYALWGSLIILIVAILFLSARRFKGTVLPFPVASKSRVSVGSLAFLALLWVCVALPPQREQFRFTQHASLVAAAKYRESIDYLARFKPNDFPPSRRLAPDPYEYEVFERLPRVVAQLRPDDPLWVRELYLKHLSILFSHYFFHASLVGYADMFDKLEQLPEGRQWITDHSADISKLQPLIESHYSSESDEEVNARVALSNTLSRLGVYSSRSK